MINTYSLKTDGSRQLSQNFYVKEFACRDGSDLIKIDSFLIVSLQEIRDFFRVGVRVTSGYRTLAYNTRIGGARNSYHLKGMAADIDVGSGPELVNPKLVAMYAQAIGILGIGCYIYADGQSWVHVDTRTSQSFWTQAKPNSLKAVSTHLPTLRKPLLKIWNQVEDVKIMQQALKLNSYYTGDIDGKFWNQTVESLKRFQAAKNLTADGVCGPVTWTALFTSIRHWV
jgi:hypothetical protein